MKNNILALIIVIGLTGCAPTPEQMAAPLQETLAGIPTQTSYPTYTVPPTYTPYPTYTKMATSTPIIKVVTATNTATPEYTPTDTETPTPTVDPLYTDKGPGYYLVGVDIGPGTWRSQGEGSECYWAVTTKTDDILNNNFGAAGVTAFIPASGFQVEFGDGCGNWKFLGQ